MHASRLVSLGAALIMIVSACSSASDDVQITVQVGVDGGAGTFSAEGDGICSGGVFATVAFELAANGATFRDKYDCEDGSGSFFLIGEVDIATDLTSYTGTWEVEDASGSGAFQDTTGSGTLTGETEPEWVVKYEGQFDGF